MRALAVTTYLLIGLGFAVTVDARRDDIGTIEAMICMVVWPAFAGAFLGDQMPEYRSPIP